MLKLHVIIHVLVVIYRFAVITLNGDYLIFMKVSLTYHCFRNFFMSKLLSSELNAARTLSEVLLVRDGVLCLENFDRDEVDFIITALSTC